MIHTLESTLDIYLEHKCIDGRGDLINDLYYHAEHNCHYLRCPGIKTIVSSFNNWCQVDFPAIQIRNQKELNQFIIHVTRKAHVGVEIRFAESGHITAGIQGLMLRIN